MSAPVVLELRAGGLRLALRPDLGGCIAGLWRGGLAVLHSEEPSVLHTARPSGCFPLAPYSNRLAHRRFEWGGKAYTTLPNSGVSPHSMHGVAWQRPWEVLAAQAHEAELRYCHVGDAAWPFDFELRHRFELRPDALTLRLHVTNSARLPQPMGLGWHPYFARRGRSHLRVGLARRWDNDDSGLPTAAVPQAGVDDDVAQLAFDHCFDGWPGVAHLGDEALQVTLTSSLPYLVVYTPHDKPFFCVEPVSHVNNAINLPDPQAHGLHELAPGESFEAWMTLEVRAA